MSRHSVGRVVAALVIVAGASVRPSLLAQAYPQTPAPPADKSMQMSTPSVNTSATSDADFLIQAARTGMQEIEAARFATARSTNADVKAYAERIIADHGKSGDELAAIATKYDIALPGQSVAEEDKTVVTERLMGLSGIAFDRAYMGAEMADHQTAVDLFEKEVKDGTNADLKAFADKTLSSLKDHLKQARNVFMDLK